MLGVECVNTHSVCGAETKALGHLIRVIAIERGPYSNQFTFLTAEPCVPDLVFTMACVVFVLDTVYWVRKKSLH